MTTKSQNKCYNCGGVIAQDDTEVAYDIYADQFLCGRCSVVYAWVDRKMTVRPPAEVAQRLAARMRKQGDGFGAEVVDKMARNVAAVTSKIPPELSAGVLKLFGAIIEDVQQRHAALQPQPSTGWPTPTPMHCVKHGVSDCVSCLANHELFRLPQVCKPGSHVRPNGLSAPCQCGELPPMRPETSMRDRQPPLERAAIDRSIDAGKAALRESENLQGFRWPADPLVKACDNYSRPAGVLGGPCLTCGFPQPDHVQANRRREGDQPLPTPNQHPSMHDLVAQDLMARKALGLKRYGTVLQPFNGRSFPQDAFEEMLDLLVYWKGEMEQERLAPRKELIDIIRRIVYASDLCHGHEGCTHTMDAWTDARKLIVRIDEGPQG